MSTLYEKAKKLLEQFPALHQLVIQVDNRLFNLRLSYNINVRKKMPLIIYQMGKVASQSIYWSFPFSNYDFVMTTHSMNPASIADGEQWMLEQQAPIRRHLYQGRSLYYHIAKPRRKARYITPVREPIGRNLSSFFQGYKLFAGTSFSEATYSIQDLTQRFLSDNFPHDLPLNWFDQEYQEMLGIDIYQYPFPHDKGYLRVTEEHADILLLRVNLDDASKEAAIAEFLELPDFKLASANVGAEKAYAEIYQQFKQQIVLPAAYINRMLDAKYTQHFFSESERENIRQHWLNRVD